MKTTEDEQYAFERWVSRNWAEPSSVEKSGDQYKFPAISYARQGWLAALEWIEKQRRKGASI